jgi:hypothetical protein
MRSHRLASCLSILRCRTVGSLCALHVRIREVSSETHRSKLFVDRCAAAWLQLLENFPECTKVFGANLAGCPKCGDRVCKLDFKTRATHLVRTGSGRALSGTAPCPRVRSNIAHNVPRMLSMTNCSLSQHRCRRKNCRLNSDARGLYALHLTFCSAQSIRNTFNRVRCLDASGASTHRP